MYISDLLNKLLNNSKDHFSHTLNVQILLYLNYFILTDRWSGHMKCVQQLPIWNLLLKSRFVYTNNVTGWSSKQPDGRIRVKQIDFFPRFWKAVMNGMYNSSAILELMWSLHNTESCVTHVQRMSCMFVIFHCPEIEPEPSVTTRGRFPFPSWRITHNVKSDSEQNPFHCFQNHLLALCTPAAPPHHCMMLLPSAFGASLPAREQTGNNGAFPVHPVRVVLSGSWWCENWHLVLYVWPLTHRTVNAI